MKSSEIKQESLMINEDRETPPTFKRFMEITVTVRNLTSASQLKEPYTAGF